MNHNDFERKIGQLFIFIGYIPACTGFTTQYLWWNIFFADKIPSAIWIDIVRFIIAFVVAIGTAMFMFNYLYYPINQKTKT